MKFTKTLLASAIALTVSQSALANWTTSAVLKNETAFFSKDGGNIGAFGTDTIVSDNTSPMYGMVTKGAASTNNSGDILKSETSARIFMNGDFENGTTAHIELRPVFDSKAPNSDYEAHQSYTQQDFLREAYVDTTTSDGTYLRIGKQQIVWGKADGAKFLDLINPTDYREMAQNSMDESRITVWGLNAEKILDDGSTIQVTLTQPKENLFAGLNRNIDTSVRANNADLTDATLNNGTDEGHAFILMGPNSITGRQDGFLNVVPDLGSVAGRFAMAFGGLGNLAGVPMTGFTVDGFEQITMTDMAAALGGGLPAGFQTAVDNVYGGLLMQFGWNGTPGDASAATAATALNNTMGISAAGDLTGAQMLAWGFQPLYNTNLANLTAAQDTAFDYMGGTSFFSFDSFVNAKSQYVYDMPEDYEVDLGMKWSKALENGANLSLAYSYNYDKNPIINLSWRNSAGDMLYANHASVNGLGNGFDYDADGAHIILTDQEGDLGTIFGDTSQNYGGAAQAAELAAGGTNDYSAIMRFEQTVERVHNIGTAFDYALDTESLGPVVLRGEFVYTKDGYQPVMDKAVQLNTGDLVAALKMEQADRFKYVLGADVTVLTDMMMSAQFIQERNLDFVDSNNRYTTSYASMSMPNGFIKDIENKEFYSLFFSKPFGESGEGRWNNITMLEEGGGRWNRFDVEYSLSNDVIGTFEINKYWGDENSQFGQLENSSNVQVGLKYIIE